jgi:hypothetical protein
MKPSAPTYAETLEAARRAAEEIRREWPEWKQALSAPSTTTDRHVERQLDVAGRSR